MTLTTDAGPLAAEGRTRGNPATRRRIAFAGLAGLTWAAVMALAAAALAPGGYDAADVVTLVLLAAYLPWSVFCFWNALIGFLIMRFARDPLALTCPPAAAVRGDEPITATTALAMCVRNEDTDRVFRNLGLLADDLKRTGTADRFRLYVLSDTNRPEIAAAEEAAVAALRSRLGDSPEVHYRRRTTNPGFKAGNIKDFLERWGGDNDFALVLDADSYMAAPQILAMVRIMQASPRLGILQSLTVGLPSTSPLARLFQFGMRLGMRSYTLGSAWWHADCGPYWGHNALIRTAAFAEHCHLPRLAGTGPLSGDIMSHDQVEAVLMRKGGYEVRVIPAEGGSYEENPPTLIEFIRRDMRWCMGNTQYWKLLGLPGILPASRFQLVLAVAMFVASPAYLGMWGLTLGQALAKRGTDWLAAGPALGLVALMGVMMFAPKIMTGIDVLFRPAARASFGGGLRFAVGFVTETIFALLLTPISMLSHTLMMGALLFGRTVGWTGQVRDAHAVPWGEAFARLWPHTLVGAVASAGLLALSWEAFLWSTPLFLGLLLAVPFTVLTSSPAFGRLMTRLGWCRIPEEVVVPEELKPLGLPALAGHA
ncbi:glucans biosynthesis glucosyltransferase MdoH [Prosthecomicrobium sp. N25]|uniref:glucans biosynthesis glucosyltransferase MdoH n=1 Tax=Prosthecomicrobium sp. N25 TaxID=3129254 RepID=UPI00307753F4